MSRRYDSKATTFDPDGRLQQVEYAIECINHDASVIGVLAKDGKYSTQDQAVSLVLTENYRPLE